MSPAQREPRQAPPFADATVTRPLHIAAWRAFVSQAAMSITPLTLVLAALLLPVRAFELPAASSQCLVGTASDWNSSSATLQLYQKSGGRWTPDGAPWQARLGKSGLVWGLGLHPVPSNATIKQEGDLRSPAGVFAIGGAWGYQASLHKHPQLDYRQVTSRDLWIEDPTSPQYNQNVILDHEPATPWEKKQQMKQSDPAHALKLFIAHNAPPKAVPNAGSSIFFHIWRGGGSRATAGCTSMDETKLRALVARIDPTRHPLYILLPKAAYEKYRTVWQLP
jgi:L,D-peptidoglycan transpeptidase YkuD (ErfK/YbiS/YcfS/YnhG family)